MRLSNLFLPRVSRYTLLIAIGWSVFIFILLGMNIYWASQRILEVARTEARASIDKDILYRRWNAGHGGVYVPPTKDTPPNPYLHVPERDVVTTDGRELTLVNPAYMTRQVFELQQKQSGAQSHITSLRPIRPENAADAWETKALQAFESGVAEISSQEMMNGQEFMRLMRPLVTEQGCLKCHADQGYHVGDVRGGISVSIPLEKYAPIRQAANVSFFTGYGLVWLSGLLGIYAAFRSIQKRVRERVQADVALQKANEQLQIKLDEIAGLQGALREQAIRDPLTGLYNRRYMEEVLKQEHARALREKYMISLVMFDLDLLKNINDTHGHAGGDAALKAVAEHIKNAIRAEDIACRYGGDEFLVILHNTPLEIALRRVEQWRDAVAAMKVSYKEKLLQVSISAGVAVFPLHGQSMEDVVLAADVALYSIKSTGRNRVAGYKPKRKLKSKNSKVRK
jgi:diguanylate cyclase (GGDEF)-like protein